MDIDFDGQCHTQTQVDTIKQHDAMANDGENTIVTEDQHPVPNTDKAC